MKYTLREDTYGVDVYDNGCYAGRIDNVKIADLDEEMIEELLFSDLEEGEHWID